jgi:sulfur carrier protein ThiS
MNELKASVDEILVHLVLPGVGARDYRLSEGATLAELLRMAETSATGQAILVDGRPLIEGVPLHEGVVVTIIPQAENSPEKEPWRAAIPAFRDEELFREYSEILESQRHEDPIGEDEEG